MNMPATRPDGYDPDKCPPHFMLTLRDGRQVELIDVIDAASLPHHEACAVEYIFRAGRHANRTPTEDLAKALFRIRHALKLLTSGS